MVRVLPKRQSVRQEEPPSSGSGLSGFRMQLRVVYRAGVSQGVPKVRGFAVSLGIRGEGVPVRDLLGDSNGFRRPGSIVSVDPGFMWNYKHDTFSVNGPWAIYRDRPPSVPEIQNNVTNGDAFFADYTVIASIAHHF